MIIAENPGLYCRLCWLASFHPNLRIKYNPNCNSGKVELVTENPTKFLSDWRCYLSTILVVHYAFQCILRTGSTPVETIIAWIALALLLLCQLYIYELRRKPVQIASLINGLYQFDRMYGDSQKGAPQSLEIKVKIAFVYCLLLSAVALPPAFAYGLHLGNPCKITLPGYWLIHACSGGSQESHYIYDILIRSFVTLLYHWQWSFSEHAAIYCVATLQVFNILALQQLIQG